MSEDATRDAKLLELLRKYPLPSGWAEPELFRESTCIDDVCIELAGLIGKDSLGQEVTGSAAAIGEQPLIRAYFELVERVAVIEAMRNPDAELELKNMAGEICGSRAAKVLFPSTRREDRWRRARSNGVAANTDWSPACERARWELVERDRVLRSWYGSTIPRRIALPEGLIPAGLLVHWEVEAYQFDSERSLDADTWVAGVFAFPRRAEVPLSCGFAGGLTQKHAVGSAARECVQRIGFLWGEDIPKVQPEPTPTPDYHQEYYLYPANHAQLRTWLRGEHRVYQELLPTHTIADEPVLYVDLSPRDSGPIVAKAVCDSAVPLLFGRGDPEILDIPEAIAVHPIA